jgi:hypothetical protein
MRRGLRYTARALPLAALLCAASFACDARIGEPGTVTPGERPPPDAEDGEGEHAGSSVGELQMRLDTLTSKRDATLETAMSDVDTCEQLCDLATSICEVAKRLEVIANRNAGNESYQVLERQAQLECREAMESCTNCVGGFENQGPPPQEDEAGKSEEPTE